MQVYEISVTRGRKAQPKEYESAWAEATVRAQVGEGEDHKAVLASLLNDARDAVYENIGIKIPARATKAPDAEKPAAPPAAPPAESKPAEAPEASNGSDEIPGGEADAPPADDKPAPRKRRNKNQMEVARNAEKYGLSQEQADAISPEKAKALVEGGEVPGDEIPGGGGEAGRGISDNPEDRQAPGEDLGAFIPDDDGSGADEQAELDELLGEGGGEEEVTAETVTQLVRELVTGNKLKPAAVKELMANTGSKKARIQDLEPENLVKLNAELVAIRDK